MGEISPLSSFVSSIQFLIIQNQSVNRASMASSWNEETKLTMNLYFYFLLKLIFNSMYSYSSNILWRSKYTIQKLDYIAYYIGVSNV